MSKWNPVTVTDQKALSSMKISLHCLHQKLSSMQNFKHGFFLKKTRPAANTETSRELSQSIIYFSNVVLCVWWAECRSGAPAASQLEGEQGGSKSVLLRLLFVRKFSSETQPASHTEKSYLKASLSAESNLKAAFHVCVVQKSPFSAMGGNLCFGSNSLVKQDVKSSSLWPE